MNKKFIVSTSAALLALGFWLFPFQKGEENSTEVESVAQESNLEHASVKGVPENRAGAVTKAPLQVSEVEQRGELIAKGKWGTQEGEFGRLEADESDPQAPMGFIRDHLGNTFVLDQVNGRVQRLSPTGEVTTFKLRDNAAEDITLSDKGEVVVMHRLEKGYLEVFAPNGQKLTEIAPLRQDRQQGSVTSVHALGGRYFIEYDNRHSTTLDLNGKPETNDGKKRGLPNENASSLVKTGVIEKKKVYIEVYPPEGGRVEWDRQIEMPGEVIHILAQHADSKGYIFVAGELRSETGAVKTFALRTSVATGAVTIKLLPPTTDTGFSSYRPLQFESDGTLVQMHAEADGLKFYRYSL